MAKNIHTRGLKSSANIENKKTRIAYMTSCRELGNKGSEKIGRVIIDPETNKNLGYREGLLEHLLKLCISDKKFGSKFSVDLIIFDDLANEYDDEWSTADLWPKNLTNAEGVTAQQMSKRIPSLWRKEQNLEKKEQRKKAYEQEILELLIKNKIDLVVVDSYMCIIGKTLLDAYRNRLINVHPGILSSHTLYTPGAFPTRDSITRAKYGYVITDDKRSTRKINGDTISIEYRGQQREAVRVRKVSYAGVTVHLITEKVDDGPIIIESKYYFNKSTVTEEILRQRNYNIKNRLVPIALVKYVIQNKSLFRHH